jgi:hypothetical protein
VVTNSAIVGIAKLRPAIQVRAVQRAALAGVVLSVGDTLETVLPTGMYIALISLLDESLKEVIGPQYEGQRHERLYERIEFLKAENRLKHPERLHSFR